jgi:hypothetical protein
MKKLRYLGTSVVKSLVDVTLLSTSHSGNNVM